MNQNDNSVTSQTKESDSQDMTNKQGNEVEHAHNTSQPNLMPKNPGILPQTASGPTNQYQYANYVQPINNMTKNGGDQYLSGLGNQMPFNSPMKHSVFDFDEERNDEESICSTSRVKKRSPRTKSQQSSHISLDEIKTADRKSVEIAKHIDINIELEANSSGSDDPFYDQYHPSANKANFENIRMSDRSSSQQSAGLLQKRTKTSSEKRELAVWKSMRQVIHLNVKQFSIRKSDQSRQERENSKQSESHNQVGQKMSDIGSSKKSGQNISQIMPVKSPYIQDKIELFEQQEFLENQSDVRRQREKSPAQTSGSPKSVSELSSPDKSQSLSDDKDSSSKSNEKSLKRQKLDTENMYQEDMQMTQSDQQYLEEIQATYNTDIKKLIMEDIREQNQILSDLNMYKLQTLKKAISNYERSLPQNMLYKIQTKINDFYILIDKQADKVYQKYAENHQGKEKELDLENDNSLYMKDNFLDKTKFFDENIPIMRQIDEEITLDNGIIQFNWEPADKFRAKLYQLDSEGRWHDLGTGYFSIEYKSEGFYQMVLIGEQNRFHNLLENEVIEQRISFHRQRETIITWSDKEREQDLAISFQNNQGALYTWHKICMIIGCDPEQTSQDSQVLQEEDYFIHVSYETIPKMAEELRGAGCIESQNKNQIADHFLESDGLNLQKLGELFEECEKEYESTEMNDRYNYLQYFFAIYKGLLLLNDQRLLEVLMTDRFYLQSFGALEWDPDALVYDDSERKISKDQEEKKQDEQVKQEIQEKSQNTPQANGDNGSEANRETEKEQNEYTIDYKTKSTLNYRQFLTKIVKFKKVIPLTYEKKLGDDEESQTPQSIYNNLEIKSNSQGEQAPEDLNNESATQGTQGGHTQAANMMNSSYTIEERIHINYRLQFLKDTVMARYIDDQSINAISQLVMQNNTKIVQFIFDEDICTDPYQDMISIKNSGLGNRREQRISLKDQIIDKIQDKQDMNIKAMAIEFMIELCQILKGLQYQSSVGNASNFIYGNGTGGGMQNKSLYDKLYEANFIGILAETFALFTPNKHSLDLHLKIEEDKNEESINNIVHFYQKSNEMDTDIIRELIQAKQDQITKLDHMKVNSMEIIISFQNSVHVPITNINSYVMGNSQSQKGYPFFDHLVQHLIYSPEQGLKIQIAEFFKSMFDQEISQLTSPQNRETLYREILVKFVAFLEEFQDDYKESNENIVKSQIYRQYEYSAYLILQILNKVIEQHRYPLNIFINQNSVIQVVANLCTVNSRILNIEIVKFYKSIIRSKVSQYISLIVAKNLFFPINRIFEQTYHPTNPPMIQSVIRELFEMIFSNYSKTVNEFFNARLFDYLTHTHQESKNLIKNPKYKEVFQKYDKLNHKEEEDIFLHSSKGSNDRLQTQSPQNLIHQEHGKIPASNFFKKSYMDFKEFQGDSSDDGHSDEGEMFKKSGEQIEMKLLGNRYNEEEIGNLSPIGNPYMNDEAEDNINLGYNMAKSFIDDLDFEKSCMTEKQGGSQRSSKSVKDEGQVHDQDKYDYLSKINKIDCSKSDQLVQQQESFKQKILKKRKEQEQGRDSILASKTSSVKSKENYNNIENGIIFERISTSSQGEQELAQDMGIFSGFELNKKHIGSDQKVLSPKIGKRPRTNSFDDQDIQIEKQSLGNIFTNKTRSDSVKDRTSSLQGIFANKKPTSTHGYGQRIRNQNLPFSKIKIERGQKQNSVDDAPSKDDIPAPAENMHSSGSQSAKKITSQTLLDNKPKGTSSPSPNDTIKLELTSTDQILDVESPDEPLVPLSQNRGNIARIKEDDQSENENEVQDLQESSQAPKEEAIIEEENKLNLKRKIEETSIIEQEKEENLKRQKVEETDKK